MAAPLKQPHLHEVPRWLSVFLGGRGSLWAFLFFSPTHRAISQSHSRSLGFVPADNKLPFSLTFHRALGNGPGSAAAGHVPKNPLLGPTHSEWVFFFSCYSIEVPGGPGSWAGSAGSHRKTSTVINYICMSHWGPPCPRWCPQL